MDDTAELDTQLVHSGRSKALCGNAVNPKIERASTYLFDSVTDFMDTYENADCGVINYARYGSPQIRGFQEYLAALHGGDHCLLTGSGLSANNTAILACVKAGDHLLMTDSCYGPVRMFCDNMLKSLGVEVEYYDPLIGAGIAAQMRPNTSVVYVESPGSLTFEMQDIPAISAVAHKHGAVVIADTTWSSPTLQDSFAVGIDILAYSGTKYISGHSDLLLGVMVCQSKHFKQLQSTYRALGHSVSPDDVYLAQRGMRTLAVRLERQAATSLALAEFMAEQDAVLEVRHPAMPESHGHEIWQRDYLGSNGLFAFRMRQLTRAQLSQFIDGMRYFGIGVSWGGYESLMIPCPMVTRTASSVPDGTWVRLHAGLEHVDDLKGDLARGLARIG